MFGTGVYTLKYPGLVLCPVLWWLLILVLCPIALVPDALLVERVQHFRHHAVLCCSFDKVVSVPLVLCPVSRCLLLVVVGQDLGQEEVVKGDLNEMGQPASCQFSKSKWLRMGDGELRWGWVVALAPRGL